MRSERYLITPEPDECTVFLANLENTLRTGITLVQLRATLLSLAQYSELAAQVVPLCHRYNAKVVLNRHIDLVTPLQADGAHLTHWQLNQYQQRPLQTRQLLSAACHNRDELLRAQTLRVDFVTLSPVKLTETSTHRQPLGWKQFSELTKQVNLPIYALGGMTCDDILVAQSHGAVGIAAIRSLWVS